MSKLPVWNYEVVAEKWRLITYCAFWFFVSFAIAVTRLVVVDRLQAGPKPGTPANQMGCGPFHFGVSSVYISYIQHALDIYKKQKYRGALVSIL